MSTVKYFAAFTIAVVGAAGAYALWPQEDALETLSVPVAVVAAPAEDSAIPAPEPEHPEPFTASVSHAEQTGASGQRGNPEADGLAALDRQDDATAETLLRQALDADPALPVALGELLLILHRADREPEAETLLVDILARCDDCPEARIELAERLAARDETERAVDELQRATAFSSVSAVAWHKLAEIYRKQGENELAAVAAANVLGDVSDISAEPNSEESIP